MTHRIDIRLPDELYRDFRKLDGKISENVRYALRAYINQGNNSYNQDVIQILKNQVLDLQTNRDNLQARIDYLMQPWYRRITLPKLKQ